MSVTFVYRSHYEGPLSKRVVRFEDPSVLAWFQRVWPLATKAADPGKRVEKELGADVYGFATLFEAAKKKAIPAPRTLKELRALLGKHLYVEGGVRLDDHTLRVHTDDDEVELAYFFFDDKAAAPERVAYLLHDTLPLLDGGKAGKFSSPVEPSDITPSGAGKGRTFFVFLTFYDSDSLECHPQVLEGVRIPDLLGYLCSVEPPKGKPKEPYPTTWPLELRLLRACIQPDDQTLAPACARAAAYPLHAVGGNGGTGRAGLGPQDKAMASFEALAQKSESDADPKKSQVHTGEHLLQLATHQTGYFGYQQWFAFDDQWAAAQPDLAASLLRYAAGWDPWTDGDDDDDD